jgi:DNA modification methylase
LKVFGQRKPVAANKRTGAVEAGNGTLEAARALEWSHLAVVWVDDDPATAAGFSIADNRTSELAEWDTAALDKLLREVNTGNDPELDAMMADLAKSEGLYRDGYQTLEDDEAPVSQAAELQKKWKTAPGQLWVIPSKSVEGKAHRLLCGDSTKAEDVKRVMGGERAGLMNTDPPYGVDLAGVKPKGVGLPKGVGFNTLESTGPIENDDLTDGPKLQAFLESAIRAALPHLIERPAFYLWHPMLTQGTFFAAAAAAADILIHRQIIWVKPHLVLTRSGMYHWKHELCFYGWIRGKQCAWHGDKTQVSVWEVGEPTEGRCHPTQKPLELFARPMRNHLKEGELAYEPFSGSGSQLIAAEQLSRLCYAIELEPKYVAVALERLKTLGLEPHLEA